MKLHQRRNFFMIFAIFFIVCAPLLVIYSIGFNINFKNTEIKPSLSVKINTSPIGANIATNGKESGLTPLDFTISNDQQTKISISKPDFVSEDLILQGIGQSNSFADLSGFSLLPTVSQSVFKPSQKQQIIAIISESQAIIDNNGSVEIIDFVLSGIVGSPQIIRQQPLDGGKNTSKSDLTKELISSLTTNSKVQWQKLDQNYFYRENLVLIKKYDYWLIVDLSKLSLNASEVIRLDSRRLLILDTENKLWIYNIETKINTFFDQGFEHISATPYSIWLWKNDTIYKLENQDLLDTKLNLQDRIYLKNPNIKDQVAIAKNESKEETKSIFSVQNLFQGIAIQTGKLLYYVPDYQQNKWQLISNNAQNLITQDETIFWVDTDGNMYTYNMHSNKQKLITKNVLFTSRMINKIGYNKEWKRIMLYYPQKVDSIWYNKDAVNETVKEYSYQNWLNQNPSQSNPKQSNPQQNNNLECYQKIVDKVQYCLQNNEIIAYKNNSLF